ncbi:beta-1,3-glucan-binding protein-like [Aricia agestis]|uniref:beta-1,3-glucan-binding protein-like n=1 Tax=Aricia agestis TaxID=91739 RepID=UPI001C207295|nr:beta-1,3-glucan-binding protein-like [Aricia agestis]
MSVIRAGRVLVLVFCYVLVLAQNDFKPPKVTIQPLKPKGIRLFIPEIKDITLFVFHGNVNREIEKNGFGEIRAEIPSPKDGLFFYQSNDVKLKPGDVIYYYTSILMKGAIQYDDQQTFIVEELIDPNSSADAALPVGDCPKTLTVVRDLNKACSGQIIFEDNFDGLREDLWRLEQYIPDEPDYAFVSYQRPPNAPTISVGEGFLRIEPRLLQNLPNFSSHSISAGTLDLYSGCTSSWSRCRTLAWGASILPPVVSGRITTKSFAFKYGTIEIRAKLPQGDWIYPDILLQSFYERYGSLNFGSGVVRIAGARGNKNLKGGNTEYGNKVLYGGVIMNVGCRNHLIRQKVSKEAWGDRFHVYSMRWTPERITLFVDDDEWARVEPAAGGLQSLLPRECQLPRTMLANATKIAPFDDLFGITLGVAAGGVLEFEDNLNSNGVPKPWKNSGRKASYYFWQDLISWSPTWTSPALVVDYVRVRAL